MALALTLVILAWVVPVLRSVDRRLRADPPHRPPPPRLSFALELVPVHHPLERCWVCKNKIGLDRGSEALMWQRVEGASVRYLHRECADDHGDPVTVRVPTHPL